VSHASSNSGALAAADPALAKASASIAGPLAPPPTDAHESTRDSTPASPSAGMTTDGKVILNLPPDISADVDIETGYTRDNGPTRIDSDWKLPVVWP
jgi:hypothetical protein